VQFGWLLAQSPYRQVQPDTAYRAVLFTIFEGDIRVSPQHARKMAAALQHATTTPAATTPAATRPVLVRREHDVGHTARAVSRYLPLWLDQLGFFASQLGLEAGGGR
jgi:prolyl oligopeptidase